MSIENWKIDLAPLLHGFKAPDMKYPEVDRCFTDQFGNVFEFNQVWNELEQILQNPALGTVAIDYIDRGHLSYTAYKHADSYYIFYETRINTNFIGHFTQFVIVPDLEGIRQFVDGLKNDDY